MTVTSDASRIVETFEAAQDRLVLQASDLSLQTVADMASSGAIDIAPQFQRRERWSVAKQSALIESFLLNIPVPPVYLAEDEFGRYSVIDGKQRISAIRNFMTGQLRLTSLSRFEEVEGRRFEGLPPPLRNALQVRPYIRAVALLRQSNPQVKYEVFHRLNTGGEALNAQEIRNVIYRGPLNDLIYRLGESLFLRQQLKVTSPRASAYREMTDAEYVLRFLTLSETWEQFSGDMRRSLDEFMARDQVASTARLSELQARFENALALCELYWGRKAFQRYEDGSWRDQTLGGMYDAEMVAVSLLAKQDVAALSEKSDSILTATTQLFVDEQFEKAVRVATNTPRSVRYRIETMRELLSAAASSG